MVAAPSVLMTRARCLRRGRLRLIARWCSARQDFMDGRWPRSHIHARMPLSILLVKVGIPVVDAVVPVQVDRKNLQDRSALCFKGRKEIWARQDVVEVVMQHVEVVENRRRFGELF